MLFSINNSNHIPVAHLRAKIILLARLRIVLFPMRATEQQLDKFLIGKYQMSLKLTCLSLLAHIKITADQQNTETINITFMDRKSDHLAAFITYGNGIDINGSKILQVAFNQQY